MSVSRVSLRFVIGSEGDELKKVLRLLTEFIDGLDTWERTEHEGGVLCAPSQQGRDDVLDGVPEIVSALSFARVAVSSQDLIYPLTDLWCEYYGLRSVLKSDKNISLQDPLIRCIEEKTRVFVQLVGGERATSWRLFTQKSIMALFGISHRNTVAAWADAADKVFIKRTKGPKQSTYYLDTSHAEVKDALEKKREREKKRS